MSSSYRLGELARRVGGVVRGDADRVIRGVATLGEAEPDHLSFLTNPRYRKAAASTRAGAVLVRPDSGLADHDLLEAPEPYVALTQILELYHPWPRVRPGISPDARLGADVRVGTEVEIGPFAVIGDGTVIGDRVVIGAGSVVGSECELGDDTQLRPRVVVYPGTRVGARCLVHAGVVLGGDGFGFATSGGKHRKIPQVGRVVIEDDVEIGPNSAIDRAMLGETRIGAGSKIDDLVMIAHGVHLGPDALLAGQVGIAGSSMLGSNNTLAGQVGVAGHLETGDGVTVAAKSAVFEDQPAGAFVSGVPAIDHRRWRRVQALVKRLPELKREIRDLHARIAALESRRHGEE